MKSKLFITALVLSTGFAYAQVSPVTMTAPPPAENKNAPEFKFEEEEYNFGTIKQGEVETHNFTFVNTGKEPLIISNAVGSCGCTVPTWPKEPILKGQSAVVQVHYDTKRVGAFTKNVTITSNAKTTTKVLK